MSVSFLGFTDAPWGFSVEWVGSSATHRWTVVGLALPGFPSVPGTVTGIRDRAVVDLGVLFNVRSTFETTNLVWILLFYYTTNFFGPICTYCIVGDKQMMLISRTLFDSAVVVPGTTRSLHLMLGDLAISQSHTTVVLSQRRRQLQPNSGREFIVTRSKFQKS